MSFFYFGELAIMRNEPITEKNIAPTIVCSAPWRLTKVRPLEDFIIEVDFVDGTHGYVEMKPLIMSDKAGVFSKLRDINLFNQIYLELGVVTWPGEIDLAPDTMHNKIKSHGTWIVQ
jgi:hypothetical protein